MNRAAAGGSEGGAPASVTESIVVDGREVGLIVSLLAPEEKARVAASIASVAVAAMADTRVNAAAWRTFLDDVLSRYVAFTLSDAPPQAQAVHWWDELFQHATTVFVRVNGLAAAIRRDFVAFGAGAASTEQPERPH